MYQPCIACGGSGGRGCEEHVDLTLPPPPCRLCHPEEARLHMSLARETRTIAGAHRLAAYQALRVVVTASAMTPVA